MIDYGFGVQLGPISNINPELILKWRNDNRIYKWSRQYEPLESWGHHKWIENLPSKTDVKMYGIFYKNKPIGVCGLTSIDFINSRAEFSIYIDPKNHKKGFGQKSLMTLCSHGFECLNLNNIWGETFQNNSASKTFEKIGFKKDGTRRSFYFREGKYINSYIYSLLRSEYDRYRNNPDNNTSWNIYNPNKSLRETTGYC